MSKISKNAKIVLPGGSGLVGQNLVILLKESGYNNLVVIDKNQTNSGILQKLHPDIKVIITDISKPGRWQEEIHDADVVIQLQAQIGGLLEGDFIDNNIISTKLVLASVNKKKPAYLIHISSSVVKSQVVDFYTETKKAQEKLVLESGIGHVILRPTLMFGWFDRKHLGWLGRFMSKCPVFPIPGNGKYIRQPLYVMDFCKVIVSCLESTPNDKIYNISGLEKVEYIEIIRMIKSAANSRTAIVNLPYRLFYLLLKVYALFYKNPPFTVKQLQALVTKEEFEIIDWPKIFNIAPTKTSQAIKDTFNHQTYSKITLDF